MKDNIYYLTINREGEILKARKEPYRGASGAYFVVPTSLPVAELARVSQELGKICKWKSLIEDAQTAKEKYDNDTKDIKKVYPNPDALTRDMEGILNGLSDLIEEENNDTKDGKSN